jgi:aryl-alcohol dehydrogenase-like predicted oxidoreductase
MTDSGQVRDASPEWLRQGVDASLTALGIEHIDLYQVHWPDPKVPAAETAGALRDLVAEGKIGHVGVSNYDIQQMAEFAKTLPVETVQPPYHLFRRDIEDELLPYCREHDIGVLVYGPLTHGLLTGTLSETPGSPAMTGAPAARCSPARATGATWRRCTRWRSSLPTVA